MEQLNTTPLLKEYFKTQQQYEKKYGKQTIVIFEIGGFYEIFQNDDPPIGKAKELSDLLNIQMTLKNKSKKPDVKNPWMVGVPNYIIQKYLQKMIQAGYTVVKYDQKDIPDSKEKERVLDKIYSLGTYVSNEVPTTNYIVCIILEKINNLNYGHLSAIDLTTGVCKVFETFDRLDDTNRTENEVFR